MLLQNITNLKELKFNKRQKKKIDKLFSDKNNPYLTIHNDP